MLRALVFFLDPFTQVSNVANLTWKSKKIHINRQIFFACCHKNSPTRPMSVNGKLIVGFLPSHFSDTYIPLAMVLLYASDDPRKIILGQSCIILITAHGDSIKSKQQRTYHFSFRRWLFLCSLQ